MQEYKRILDEKEFTFDSLEQKCNALAEEGWSIVTISDGFTNRTATLVREKSAKHIKNALIEAEIVALAQNPTPIVKTHRPKTK